MSSICFLSELLLPCSSSRIHCDPPLGEHLGCHNGIDAGAVMVRTVDLSRATTNWGRRVGALDYNSSELLFDVTLHGTLVIPCYAEASAPQSMIMVLLTEL